MLLSNDRVRLRALEPEDLDLLYRWENDPVLWEVGNTLAPYSRYLLKEYIAGSDRSIYESRQLRFMIEECDTGISVGIVDLFDFEPHPNRAACGIINIMWIFQWQTSLAKNYLPVWDLLRRGRLRTGSGHQVVILMSA